MEKAGSASQAKGDGYSSYLECEVAATELTLLLTKEEGNDDEQINKHQIEKPRSPLLQNQLRIESPPPSMKDDDAEFTGIDKDKLMGFLGKELKKMEEAEKRRRREEVLNGDKAMAATSSRVACDMKQEKEMPPYFPSSQPKPQHKKLKMIGFVGKDQSHSLLPLQLTPPEMPLKIQEAITLLGGTSPVWLTQKTLTKSDVNKDLGRLFIPSCEALEQFLTNEEKDAAWVEQKSQNTTCVEKKKEEIGLNVSLVTPMGDCLEISFRIWGSLEQYVFNKTWRNVIERFDLKRHSEVQLWCFRLPVERDSKLCFAMNIIKNVQLGDEELDADQSRKRVTSKRIKSSLDNFESRPLKKHRQIKLNSDEDESIVPVEALPQEEYRAVSAKAEE